MLVIRDAQMKVFVTKFLDGFEKRRLENLAQRFPTRYAKLGEPEMRQLIRTGIRVADQLGIQREVDVSDVIDLMVAYGALFYLDPELTFETGAFRNTAFPADARVAITMARFGHESGFLESDLNE